MNWGKRKENELFTKIRKRKCYVFENLVVWERTGCEGERRAGCEGERRMVVRGRGGWL